MMIKMVEGPREKWWQKLTKITKMSPNQKYSIISYFGPACWWWKQIKENNEKITQKVLEDFPANAKLKRVGSVASVDRLTFYHHYHHHYHSHRRRRHDHHQHHHDHHHHLKGLTNASLWKFFSLHNDNQQCQTRGCRQVHSHQCNQNLYKISTWLFLCFCSQISEHFLFLFLDYAFHCW